MLPRKWSRLILLLALGVVIGSGQVILLKRLYGIPSVQSFIAVALLLAIADVLFAWNVERTTRREGPGLWNSVVGKQGQVISTVGRRLGEAGTVRVEGAIWKARCRQGIAVSRGESVRVTSRDGLILNVEPLVSQNEHSPATAGHQTQLPDREL